MEAIVLHSPALHPDPDTARLLAAPSRACLFVSQGSAAPRGWPFIVRWIDGALWCSTYSTSAKMRHIRDSDQASCLLFEDESATFPYVVVHGRVEVVEPTPDAVDTWMSGSNVASQRAARHRDRLLRGKRVFLVIRPDREPEFFPERGKCRAAVGMTDRAALHMTPEEVVTFLQSHNVGVVAGHDEAGVLVARRAVGKYEAGELHLELIPPDRRFDLGRHPELCYMVDVYPVYEQIKSVIVHGRAAWTDDAEARLQLSTDRVVSFDFSKSAAAERPSGSAS